MRSHAGPKKRPEKNWAALPLLFRGLSRNCRESQGHTGDRRDMQGIAGNSRDMQGTAGNRRELQVVGPYGHQSGTVRQFQAGGRGSCHWFLSSKAWYKLFILVVPRVPVPPTDKSLTSIKPRQQAPKFPAETLEKASHFPVGAHPSSRRGGNHLARCKAASSAEALG